MTVARSCARLVIAALLAQLTSVAPASAQSGAGAAADVGAPTAPRHDRLLPSPPRRHRPGGVATDLFIEVPLDDYSSDVVFPFGGSHHRVPGVVAVNRAPYYCAPHRRTFRDRADFVAHLRTRHGIPDAEIPRALLVHGGQVRYVGE